MSDTPPTISTEARKCAEIFEPYPNCNPDNECYQDCETAWAERRDKAAEQIQLAINTSTEALSKENAELREHLDKIARQLISEGWIKSDDILNEDIPAAVTHLISRSNEYGHKYASELLKTNDQAHAPATQKL